MVLFFQKMHHGKLCVPFFNKFGNFVFWNKNLFFSLNYKNPEA